MVHLGHTAAHHEDAVIPPEQLRLKEVVLLPQGHTARMPELGSEPRFVQRPDSLLQGADTLQRPVLPEHTKAYRGRAWPTLLVKLSDALKLCFRPG